MLVRHFEIMAVLGRFFDAVECCSQLFYTTKKEEGKQHLRDAIVDLRNVLVAERDGEDCSCHCGGCGCCHNDADDAVEGGIFHVILAVEEMYGLTA